MVACIWLDLDMTNFLSMALPFHSQEALSYPKVHNEVQIIFEIIKVTPMALINALIKFVKDKQWAYKINFFRIHVKFFM